MIIIKLADLFTLWIDIEKHVHSWKQYKCSICSAYHMHGKSIGIYVCAWVLGLPLLAYEDNPHNSYLYSDDQSIDFALFLLEWTIMNGINGYIKSSRFQRTQDDDLVEMFFWKKKAKWEM